MGRARGPGGQRVLRPVAALSTPSAGERRPSRSARVLRAFTQPARYSALLAGAVPVLAFPALALEFLAWVGLGPGLLLVVIVLGVPWAAVGLAAWRLLRGPTVRQSLAALAVLPSCWVVIDWIRSWQGIGGPWAVYGASQWQHPVELALAAVGGIWLITFVLVAANTGIVIALTAASYSAPAAGHVTLTLVQPGLESAPQRTVSQEVRLTARQPRADLVVWAESSVGYDLRTSPRMLRKLTRLSAAIGTPLLVSQDALSPAGAKSKVAVLLGRSGIEESDKESRLVPFGEYIPFRSALGWLSSISRAAPENMVTGNGARVLHAALPGGRRLSFGVLICFESAFPDMSRADANHGAQLLIYQTSDSTFQGSWAPEQHASLAAVRAAETGRSAVQAALTGDSAAFDARGRQLAWAGTAYRGVLRVTLALPRASARTPFDRLGDLVPWTAIAVVTLAAACAMYSRRRFRRVAPG